MADPKQTRDLGLILLLGLLTAAAPLSIDMYLPALPQLRTDFGVGEAAVQRSLSSFFLGLAVGQLLLGPLSDRFGRRVVLQIGLAMYLVGSVLCLASDGIAVLVAARCFQGLGGAVGPVISRAIVRDRFHGPQAARVMSFVIMVMGAAPLLAPPIGGIVVTWSGWRTIFWILTAYALLALVLVTWRLAETNPESRRQGVHLWSRFQAYATVLSKPYAVAQLLIGGLTFGGLFAFIAGAPFVFMDRFGIAADHFGFYFAANVVGMLVITYLNGRLVLRYGTARLQRLGLTVSAAAGVALAAMALAGKPGLVSVTLLLIATVSMIGFIAGNTVANLLDLFPNNAGAASALFGVFQFTMGAATSALVGMVSDDPVTAMGVVLAITGCGALGVQRLCAYLGARVVSSDLP
jgi:DHA1 family bicyclomycin/chloramphenicol resistance-like MFS transporter